MNTSVAITEFWLDNQLFVYFSLKCLKPLLLEKNEETNEAEKRIKVFTNFLIRNHNVPNFKILYCNNSNNRSFRSKSNEQSVLYSPVFFVLIPNLASDLPYVAYFGGKSTSKFGLSALFERLAFRLQWMDLSKVNGNSLSLDVPFTLYS